MADLTKRATLIVQFQNEIDAGAKSAANSLVQVDDKAKSSAKQMGLLENASKQLGGAIKAGATLALAALPAAIGAAGVAMAKMGMDMQQTRVAFTTLVGSADEANKHLQDLRDFAKSTPFQFTELTQASKLMQAFGFATKDVIPMMRDIGDATSALGVGSEGIDRVVRALGQMQAKGKVSAEEMMQLSEIGISGWKYLAEGMGKTTAEVMKMSEKGLVPAGDAIQYILQGMRQDFGGGMAAQSKTAAGQLSNLADSITEIGTTIGEMMVPALTVAIGKIGEFVDTLKRGIQTADLVINWQDKLNTAVKGVSKSLIDQKVSYDQYITGALGAAVAAGTITDAQAKEYLSTGKITEGYLNQVDVTKKVIEQAGILTRAEQERATGIPATTEKMTSQEQQLRKNIGAFRELSANTKESETATKGQAAAVETSIAALEHADDVTQRYAQTLGVSVDSLKAQKNALADTYSMAVTYTEKQREQADVQKKLDDLNKTIAARGPVRQVATMAIKTTLEGGPPVELSQEMQDAQAKLASAQAAVDDQTRRSGESTGTYAARIKNAQEELKKMTAEYGPLAAQAQVASIQSDKASISQLKLAAATEDLEKIQRKKGESDAEFNLRIAETKAKIESLSKSVETHTGVVGGATKAELEQKKALEEQIATMQKAGEVDRAKGAFEVLTKQLRDGVLTQDQYIERTTALNQVAGLYTDSALKQAQSQELLLSSLADPRSEAWKQSLDANKTAIDGVTDAEKKAADQAAVLASQETLGKQTDAANQYREALDRIPKEIEVGIKIKATTESLASMQGGDLDKRRAKSEEDAVKKSTSANNAVGEEARKTIAKTEEVSVAAVRKIGDVSDVAKSKTVDLAKSVGNAMLDMARVAGQQLDLVTGWVNSLPAYKELVYQIVIKGKNNIPEGIAGGGSEFAGGGSMLVPPGYPNDTYPIRVSSGERVIVQTPAQQAASRQPVRQTNTYNYTTIVNNPLAAAMLLDQQRRERIARSNARMGVA